MNEESNLVCPSCGTPLPPSTNPEQSGLCPACGSGDDTAASVHLHDTIASDVANGPRELADQTVSVKSNAAEPEKRPAKARETIGRFQIKTVRGEGGFGTVYKAHDPLLDRVVALKVPRWDNGERFDDLFLHEAKAAARLRHPNIVAVFECGFAGDQPYIASEYVDGTPLSEILNSGRVQVRQTVQIVQKIAGAIDYAHSEGIIHRDLKPANIMMGKGARPQVMDFGLARLGSNPDASIMSEGSIVGTPSFMAPEQARGQKDAVGPRSDQYSVGVLLYVMLCGKPPYSGETWSIVSKVADPVVVPDAPRKVRQDIPRDLEACCLKAMEKDPDRRYDSLSDLADDLTNWLKQTPVPIRMFQGLAHWHKSLSVHPSGQYAMSEEHSSDGDQCRIWQVATGELWSLPWNVAVNAAAWDDQGNLLALASGIEIRIFRFPNGEEVDRWQCDVSVDLIRFSHDGSRIAFGGKGGAGIRDFSDENSSRFISHSASVVRLVWNRSATRLATLSDDRLVRICSGDPNRIDDQPHVLPLVCPYQSQPPRIGFLDDNLLVVPESEQTIHCWDVASDKETWAVPYGSDASFAVAPNRQRLAIIDRERLVQVDVKTGEQIGPAIQHPNLVYDAQYDSTGDKILTGCGDQFARVFSADTGSLIHSMRHGDIVHRVAWFPNAQSCVTVHWKADLVRVWRLGDSSVPDFSRQLPGGVMHVKWTDDGDFFLPSGMDLVRGAGAYRVLSVDDGRPSDTSIAFPGRASDGCFVPNSSTVVMAGSASADEAGSRAERCRKQDFSRPGLIAGFNFKTGEAVFPAIDTDTNVVAIEASPDGRVVAALCHDRQLLMLDPNSGKILHRHNTFPQADLFYGFVIYRRLAFSPSGDKLAVWGSRSRTTELHSAVDGVLLNTISHRQQANVDWLHNVVFSPDGNTIATCSADQTVQLWNAETGQRSPISLRHTAWVFSAAFSQDGKQLLTACQDRQARLWNLDDPAKPRIVTPEQPDEVYGISFLPGDEIFLIGLRNGEVSAWGARQGKMIAPGWTEPDQEAVYTISVSPDQSRVIIVSRDANVRGYHPSRWHSEVDTRMTSGELQTLGEMIASQELHDGVMAGLTNESVLARWKQLFRSHVDHPLFRLPNTTEPISDQPQSR